MMTKEQIWCEHDWESVFDLDKETKCPKCGILLDQINDQLDTASFCAVIDKCRKILTRGIESGYSTRLTKLLSKMSDFADCIILEAMLPESP